MYYSNDVHNISCYTRKPGYTYLHNYVAITWSRSTFFTMNMTCIIMYMYVRTCVCVCGRRCMTYPPSVSPHPLPSLHTSPSTPTTALSSLPGGWSLVAWQPWPTIIGASSTCGTWAITWTLWPKLRNRSTTKLTSASQLAKYQTLSLSPAVEWLTSS